MSVVAFDPNKLIMLRAKADLTQDELGKLVGLSTKQISRYETGDSVPRTVSVHKLANALNCEFGDLTTKPSQKDMDDAYADAELFLELVSSTVQKNPRLKELIDKQNRDKLTPIGSRELVLKFLEELLKDDNEIVNEIMERTIKRNILGS